MTDHEKEADIDAEYNRAIRELMANKDPWVKLAAILLDRDADSAQGGRAEAVAIEKITTVTPDPPPETTIEKPKIVCSVISLPYIPNIHWQEGANIITAAGSISALPSTVKQSVIGRDFETGAAVAIGDEERCGGMYILGQPRTGKSNLLISLALADIEKGHGLFFIDPHTDAINDLIARMPASRSKDVILLDPTLKDYSFGINLLHCDDRTNGQALDRTWGRIRDIFVKVWEQEKGQLGFWLDKILRNSVYLLLENPEYTMVELPLLLREDTTFRNNLIENIKVILPPLWNIHLHWRSNVGSYTGLAPFRVDKVAA